MHSKRDREREIIFGFVASLKRLEIRCSQKVCEREIGAVKKGQREAVQSESDTERDKVQSERDS